MTTLQGFLPYLWWLLPILAIIGYKFILRVLFGMIIIPEDKVGQVTKKFVLGKKTLQAGRIIATNGEAGYQVDLLNPGLHWGMWVWQYSVDLQGFVVIPKGKIGLVSAKDGEQLPNGQIIARSVQCNDYRDARAFLTNHGCKGKQTKYINAGTYPINLLLFEVQMADITDIKEGEMAIITARDGKPLSPNQIAGTPVEGHNNFQDFDAFLAADGQRGLQTQFLLAGSYSLNPWAVTVEVAPMVEIPIGNVGIVISYVGEDGVDQTGVDFKHGNIVKKGQKGVWDTPLDPGKYPINPQTTKLQIVPTTNLVLNWATGRNESHQLDKNLSTITVRSRDGFPFNLDVSQIIHIPSNEAPKVIARFGSVQNLVSQVLEPTIGNYFRNSAQNSDVIAFLGQRKERQDEAKARISAVLSEYNVHAVDTLIGDITPPAELMKTLTDRKIAQEQQLTYGTQMEAQKVNQKLKSETALADMQSEIVAANQSVQIAEKRADASIKKATGEAESVKLNASARAFETETNGKAEASKIRDIGNATAEAYKKQVDAMGADNFGKLKVTEQIGLGKIKVMPDLFINGGSNGGSSIDGLVGIELMQYMSKKNDKNGKEPPAIIN